MADANEARDYGNDAARQLAIQLRALDVRLGEYGEKLVAVALGIAYVDGRLACLRDLGAASPAKSALPLHDGPMPDEFKPEPRRESWESEHGVASIFHVRQAG